MTGSRFEFGIRVLLHAVANPHNPLFTIRGVRPDFGITAHEMQLGIEPGDESLGRTLVDFPADLAGVQSNSQAGFQSRTVV